MSDFKREFRYFVVKLSDVEKIQLGAKEIIEAQMESIDFYLSEHGAPNRQCLVIESDWPEYEPAYKAIEDRVLGNTQEATHKPLGVRLAKMLNQYDESPSSQLWSEIQGLAREVLK